MSLVSSNDKGAVTGVLVSVAVDVAVGVPVGDDVGVGVHVAVPVGVFVGVDVRVGVFVGRLVLVGVGSGVAVGTGVFVGWLSLLLLSPPPLGVAGAGGLLSGGGGTVGFCSRSLLRSPSLTGNSMRVGVGVDGGSFVRLSETPTSSWMVGAASASLLLTATAMRTTRTISKMGNIRRIMALA